MTTTYTQGAILTIRRPNGAVEEVVNTQHARDGVVPAAVFAAMVKATREAGRGEILGQRPNVKTVSAAAERQVERTAIVGKLSDLSKQFPSAAKAEQEAALRAQLAAIDAAE